MSSNSVSLQEMSAQQLKQTINQLHAAAATPYQRNLMNWSISTSASGGRTTRSTRARGGRVANVQQHYVPPVPITNYLPAGPQHAPPNPVPTAAQAYTTTYPSRLRTGVTLLMQPIFTATPANGAGGTNVRSTRRGGAINYADPGSGDDLPDAGALDSDDSDFTHENTRATRGYAQRAATAATRTRMAPGMSVFNSNTGVTTVQPAAAASPAAAPPPLPLKPPEKAELDQSYLGMIPPSRFISTKTLAGGLTPHAYPPQDHIEREALRPAALVPIRVEFETDTHRIRDCFVWNLNEELIRPESFARIFCTDLELGEAWVETVTNQIRAQLEEHEAVARLDVAHDGIGVGGAHTVPECRVILSIDVQIATHHLLDHIEWDLLSPLTPEAFAATLCAELGLTGEAVPLVAHAVHEELLKHKKDAVEWGVVDPSGSGLGKAGPRFGGLGLGLGRGGGAGPKPLESVWRDWQEADEYRTRFEVLSAEEVERREVERERASRRLRRETSKFQSSRRRRF